MKNVVETPNIEYQTENIESLGPSFLDKQIGLTVNMIGRWLDAKRGGTSDEQKQTA